MNKAADGRRLGQCPGFRRGARLCAHRSYILFGKRSRRQEDLSLAASCPPVLAGAPAGLKPLEIAKRRGALLLASFPGWLADAGGDDPLRDKVFYHSLPDSLREQGQETARTLPTRQAARKHQPFLLARHPHIHHAPPLGLETGPQLT